MKQKENFAGIFSRVSQSLSTFQCTRPLARWTGGDRKTGDPIGAAALMLRGFSTVKALLPAESKHLRVLVACRLAASNTLGAYSQHLVSDCCGVYLEPNLSLRRFQAFARPCTAAPVRKWSKCHGLGCLPRDEVHSVVKACSMFVEGRTRGCFLSFLLNIHEAVNVFAQVYFVLDCSTK